MAKLLDLQTEGEKVEKLMSVQTADKIRNGLKDGTLKLVMDDKGVDQSSPSSM